MEGNYFLMLFHLHNFQHQQILKCVCLIIWQRLFLNLVLAVIELTEKLELFCKLIGQYYTLRSSYSYKEIYQIGTYKGRRKIPAT